MADHLVGIDFGHGVIRGVEIVDAGSRRQRAVRQGSIKVAESAVVSGEVRDVAAVASALKQLWQQTRFRSRRVVLGLGNARVLARDLDVAVRPLPQIRESLPFLVADLLPMPLENAVLDYYPVSAGTDEHGAEVYHGMLVAALKDVAMTNAQAVQQAGLEVAAIDMTPFAIIRALADRDGGETVAFVDVGSMTTIISVATAGTPEFVRSVPVGSNDVTRALIDLGGLGHDQAERVKRIAGLRPADAAPQVRSVVELMAARTGELMNSVRDTLSYFTDTRRRPLDRIVLTGGGARIGGFAEMLTARLGIPAELSDALPDMDYLVAGALASGPGRRPAASRTTGAVPVVGAASSTPAPVAPALVVAADPLPVPVATPAAPAPATVAAAAPAPEFSTLLAAPPPLPAAAVATVAAPTAVASPFADPAPAAAVPQPLRARASYTPAEEPAASQQAGRRSKPEKAAKAPKEKKDSIWTRPIGGGRK